MGVKDKTELIQVINKYSDDVRSGLTLAGMGQLSDTVISAIRDGKIEEAALPAGQTFQFMLFRHRVAGRDRNTGRQFSRGEVDVVRNLYWAGKEPVQAYILRVEDQDARYTFAIPFGKKGCTNISLIEKKPNPKCVINVSKASTGICWNIDASASYSTEDIVKVEVTVSDSTGKVLLTQDGRTPFQWCAPAPTGIYTFRAVVTNREGMTKECSQSEDAAEFDKIINNAPQCMLVVSPENAVTNQTVTIDATRASDDKNCIESNTVEIKDGNGKILFSGNGNEVIFFKFHKGGAYTITNTVKDCAGQVTVCEKSVAVTRKRGHFLLSLGGLYEKGKDIKTEAGIFDIALVVQTDPWPQQQFIRATIQQLSSVAGASSVAYKIQTFREGALIDEANAATRELMLPGPGNYRVVATATASIGGKTLTDTEEVAFTVAEGQNETFGPKNQNKENFSTQKKVKSDNWYLPLKVGYSYELVSNIEAALYGGVAVALNQLDDSALFGDFELNYRSEPVMFGVGLGWWNFNHGSEDRIDMLVNAGIVVAKSLFGSDTWTFVVQGRLPLNRDDGDSMSDEYRIFCGIRLDF